MSQPEKELTDEQMTTIFIVVGAFALGIVPVAALLEPVRAWLLETKILVTGPSMTLELFGTGVGLDPLRTVVAVTLAVLIITITAFICHHLVSRKNLP